MADLSGHAVSKTYLKAGDVDRPMNVKIDDVQIEESRYGRKPVLHFAESKLTLSTHNVKRLGKEWGFESDNWVGQTMTISTEMMDMNGKDIEVIVTTPDKINTEATSFDEVDEPPKPRELDDNDELF